MSFAFTVPSPQRALSAVVAVAVSLSLMAAAVAAPRPAAATARVQFHFDASLVSALDEQAGSMSNVARQIGATFYASNGYDGTGVDVALIDSGVASVNGLDGAGKVVYGPDVSYESGLPNLRNLDTFGHGTHMAGIIAGNSDGFSGIAPGSRIVSLKAADSHGRTDIAQIIASIRWVVENAHRHGLNIRVLNLSFGANAVTPYQRSDLAYAVEQAWAAGIVTVVSAGNGGLSSNGLSEPAYDPFVIAVGADNTRGTTDPSDDNVTSFSSRGDGARDPDVIAPGKSIVSLRVPGSYLDESHPEARTGDAYFRGSGTSQAAAVVSGAVALMLERRPRLTPDQVKMLLTSTARPLPDASPSAQGSGLIDMRSVFTTPARDAEQSWPASIGSDLDAWATVADADGNSWSSATPDGNSWSGNSWSESGWTGAGWSDGCEPDGNSWSATNWQGVSWGKKKGR